MWPHSASATDAAIVANEGVMPDVHPPIGVMGEIAHANRSIMLSYRYQRREFEGLAIGQQQLFSPPPIFTVLPTAMRADTHLLEVMWAPVDEITFVLTLPYLDIEMDQVDRAGALPYTTQSKGFGDFLITVLYRVFEDRSNRVHLNLGLSLPSGSINQSQVTPVSGGVLELLPYSMQLGSGTVDLRPGVTYNGTFEGNYWGGQITGVLHAGTNSHGYRLGNSYQVTGWAGRRLASWLATSFRLDWQHVFDPEGADPLMQPARSPAENATLQAGQRLDALFGLDIYFDGAGLSGTRLSIEGGLPVYQSLDGPQLALDWLITAGLQYAF